MIRVIAITTGDLFARGEELTGPMQLMFVFFFASAFYISIMFNGLM